MPGASSAHLRRFGLTVGGIFLLLGVVSWWRGHVIAPRVMWTIGTLLVVPGIVAPSILGPVERVWMRFAHVLGEVNARIILTVVYFLVIWPVGRVMRLFGDPLDRSLGAAKESVWVRRERRPVERARYERQF